MVGARFLYSDLPARSVNIAPLNGIYPHKAWQIHTHSSKTLKLEGCEDPVSALDKGSTEEQVEVDQG